MLRRFPSRQSRMVAFEIEAEGKRAVMSISWLTLEHEFECTIETDSYADAVFDGNAGTIGRAAEVALNEGSRVVEEKHFEDLPDGYPIG